ncbi:PREDICTED: kinase suppressor of Ras 1-like isoform X2 [Priapulus caudatus]|nr:PREDICTED: kinase suppressor of Ras 1-like isoform X2 [Priapulus caudatus]
MTKSVTRPGRCGHCQQPLLFVGLCCKYCSFRCHVKCGDSYPGKCIFRICSLSKLTKNAGKEVVEMLQTHEVNRNKLPSIYSRSVSVPAQVARPATCSKKEHGSYCRLRRWLALRKEKKSVADDEATRCPEQHDVISLEACATEEKTAAAGMTTQLQVLNQHANLVQTCSCPSPKIRKPAATPPNVLCSTWPPAGRKQYRHAIFDDDEYDETFASLLGSTLQSNAHATLDNEQDSLAEWHIPYGSLEIRDIVRQSQRGTTYRGRWHGDVMVHAFQSSSQLDVDRFWEEVKVLSMIRHENVALFMGACVEPPNLTIVTSMRKGDSLYRHVHLDADRLPLHSKITIARQIAQGMSYLHSRGIVLKRLSSKNIYLEPKVKLCVVDCAMMEKTIERANYGSLPQGHITYFSPEIMCSLKVEPPHVTSSGPYTMASDVYAFGTVLYELMHGEYPFRGSSPHCIVWQVCHARRQAVSDLKTTPQIKQLIEHCWTTMQHRPNFKSILRKLQHGVPAGMHRRHSTSQPEGLHRAGLWNHSYP